MPSDERDQPTAVVSGHVPSTPGEPHFTPGTVIGNRYRIVSLLGEGGMGRVYRADDMKLGQRVALKFLPPNVAADSRAFERIRSEVRIGRQITHPNICRIHDIVEVDGQHFISMEYVDGEDLGSLLRRIGRLPSDKALTLARDLAAGLVAAHARGIVHRDLKPANVMVDGDGNARLMDFGLAVLAHETGGRREIAGTPTYMAPEQFLGQDITQKTDVYALGLILYEMFTGRQVFAGKSVAEIQNAHAVDKTRPSSLVSEIDPAVESVILRCLEENPDDRPASAQSVLSALPGGDPLRQAIEAGKTPSPALVAAGGSVGELEPRHAWALLAAVMIGLLATTAIDNSWLLPNMVPDIRSRDAMRDRAVDILRDFGLRRPADTAGWYETNYAYLRWLAKHGGIRKDAMRESPPSPLRFVLRAGPVPLYASNRNKLVDSSDPAEDVTGMSTIVLDHTGRLELFRSVPPERADPGPSDFDWERAFNAAGLDIHAFAPADPAWTSPYGFDRRLAWTGTYPNRRDVPIRIEAASRAGLPVYFQVVAPWAEPARVAYRRPIGAFMFPLVAFGSLAVASLFARRNIARGRGDKRGALRLAIATGVSIAVARIGMATHSGDVIGETWLVLDLAMLALFRGVTVWLLYLAVEPFVRRQWPAMLIGTNRVLAGRFRDPLVGRELLIGGLGGATAAAISHLKPAAALWTGAVNVVPLNPLAHQSMISPVGFLWIVLGAPAIGIIAALIVLTLLIVFRLVLRSYAASFAMTAIGMSLLFYGGELAIVRVALELLAMSLLLFILHRYGAFAFATSYMYYEALLRGCLTFDPSAWYFLRSTATLAFLAAAAIYGFRVSLAGKPALGGLEIEEGIPDRV